MRYKIAPEDSSKWKCNWLKCAGGIGLAGNGKCAFRGKWHLKSCPYFITDEDFEKQDKEYKRWEKYVNAHPRPKISNTKVKKLIKLINET